MKLGIWMAVSFDANVILIPDYKGIAKTRPCKHNSLQYRPTSIKLHSKHTTKGNIERRATCRDLMIMTDGWGLQQWPTSPITIQQNKS